MGIPELWKELGDGEITSLASLLASYFTTHNRPLRIAIDEACWRFNNLTEQQVYAIRQKSNEPAYRGIEKNIFYRLAKLLQKNIQPIFVFDGPGKPWKKGKVSGRVDYEKSKETRRLLDVLRVPHHRAPGEAEAECARLQQEGIVDAVWSEDADALMFGCDFLIRDYRVGQRKSEVPVNGSKANSKKSQDLVRVYRMEYVKRVLEIDREGIVCFTVLTGGDYDEGLKGCGPKSALRAARHGLGKNLCAFRSQQDLAMWRMELVNFFQSKLDIPPFWPRDLHMKNYCHPKVSTPEQLHNLRGLQRGWDVPINEEKVRDFISSRFNLWTEKYMDWIGPILLLRSLVNTPPDQKTNKHDIQLTRTRKKKDAPEDTTPTAPDEEVKITFLAKSVSTLDYNQLDVSLPGHWTGKAEDPTDGDYRPKCEIMSCFLRHALPDKVFAASSTKSAAKAGKKRKADAENEEDGETTQPAKRKKAKPNTDGDGNSEPKTKRGRPKKTTADNKAKDPSSEPPSSAAKAVFRLPTSTFSPPPQSSADQISHPPARPPPHPGSSSAIQPIDLDHSSSEDNGEEDAQLKLAIELSIRDQHPIPAQSNLPLSNRNLSFAELLAERQELNREHLRLLERKFELEQRQHEDQQARLRAALVPLLPEVSNWRASQSRSLEDEDSLAILRAGRLPAIAHQKASQPLPSENRDPLAGLGAPPLSATSNTEASPSRPLENQDPLARLRAARLAHFGGSACSPGMKQAPDLLSHSPANDVSLQRLNGVPGSASKNMPGTSISTHGPTVIDLTDD